MKPGSRCMLYLSLIFVSLMMCSCVSYPKIAELPPIPQYEPEKTDWDTSATCLIMGNRDVGMFPPTAPQPPQPGSRTLVPAQIDRSAAAAVQLARMLQDRGHTIAPEERGYLTRAQRKAVDKVIRVDNAFCKYTYGSDGTSTEANITVTVYDIAQERYLMSCAAVSRVIGARKEQAKNEQAINQAVGNLLTMDVFRRALCKPRSTASGP